MPVTDADLAVDRALADVSGQLPWLRYVTPINVTEALEAFLETGRPPEFEYRPLPDLAALATALDDIDVDAVDDPVVRHMARAKERELRQRLDLLGARGSDDFFLASVELFGHVEPTTLRLAESLLSDVQPPETSEAVSAQEFATAARTQIELYRETHPGLDAAVIVDDTTSGVMVENGNLFIGSDTRISLDRVEALLAHEVGVHVLTYANGAAQPLRILSVGLAGYDETQEALGVLAEHLCSGLKPYRLHVLARRVLAVHLRSDGASFADAVQALVDTGAAARAAFITVMRAYRSGGMTKDAIYLRGLVRLCAHLAHGGTLEPLFAGKITLEDEPLVAELIERSVLGGPILVPDFLETDGAAQRLDEIRQGADIRDLGGVTT